MSDEIEEIPNSSAQAITTAITSNEGNSGSCAGSRVRVCVTGATGFIASHLVYQLLLKGYIVHGTVRSMPKGRDELYKALLAYDQSQEGKKQLSEEILQENLICFESDLLKEGSFAEAIKGCQFVQHTASPFKITVKDPQLDLVDPAVKGTRNVLGECIKLRESQSNEDPNRLQRIILTSSIASIVDTPLPDKIYNEGDWNEVSNLNKNPYFFSKVMAEKAAWSLMKEAEEKHGKGFLELVTICPAAVIGKPIFEKQVNTSHESIIMLANGGFPALFAIGFVFVDVKDVGLAHLLAMEYQKDDRTRFTPSNMERYIVCCDESTTMKQLVDILREQFPNPPHKWVKNLPSRSMEGKFGCAIAKMGSIFQPKGVRDYMQSNLGKPLYFSNKKIKDAFGMTFVDTKTQVKESTEYLLTIGQIKQ